MTNQLDKIIYFVKRTGDKVIVLKDDSEFVIMPLDDYDGLFHHKKQLAQLSEEEMLSRVNREIALWRESQKSLSELDEADEYKSEYYAPRRYRDNDFSYRLPDRLSADDRWVEPDWQDEDDYKEDDYFEEEDVEPFDFSLAQGLRELPDLEWSENKKGADDVSLPWETSVPATEKKESAPTAKAAPPKRINNFGYANPVDTDEPSTPERSYGENYDHIPPPPSR